MARITEAEYNRITGKASTARQAPSMNRTESRYAYYLETLLLQQLILAWAFEPEKLRISTGHTCTYTPDFRIVRLDGTIEFHEVKGGKRIANKAGHQAYWREDARVKIKAADAVHPYIFRAVHPVPQRVLGASSWSWETITPDVPKWQDIFKDRPIQEQS